MFVIQSNSWRIIFQPCCSCGGISRIIDFRYCCRQVTLILIVSSCLHNYRFLIKRKFRLFTRSARVSPDKGELQRLRETNKVREVSDHTSESPLQDNSSNNLTPTHNNSNWSPKRSDSPESQSLAASDVMEGEAQVFNTVVGRHFRLPRSNIAPIEPISSLNPPSMPVRLTNRLKKVYTMKREALGNVDFDSKFD